MLELKKLLSTEVKTDDGKKENNLSFMLCLKLIGRIIFLRLPFQPVIWGIILGIIVNIGIKCTSIIFYYFLLLLLFYLK
jgi:hypothetical protein